MHTNYRGRGELLFVFDSRFQLQRPEAAGSPSPVADYLRFLSRTYQKKTAVAVMAVEIRLPLAETPHRESYM